MQNGTKNILANKDDGRFDIERNENDRASGIEFGHVIGFFTNRKSVTLGTIFERRVNFVFHKLKLPIFVDIFSFDELGFVGQNVKKQSRDEGGQPS